MKKGLEARFERTPAGHVRVIVDRKGTIFSEECTLETGDQVFDVPRSALRYVENRVSEPVYEPVPTGYQRGWMVVTPCGDVFPGYVGPMYRTFNSVALYNSDQLVPVDFPMRTLKKAKKAKK